MHETHLALKDHDLADDRADHRSGGHLPGAGEQFGLGDITQSLFFSPAHPGPSGIIWGAGPVFLIPSGTEEALRADYLTPAQAIKIAGLIAQLPELWRKRDERMKRLLFWLVWNVPLGPFAPYVLGLALGSRPRRVKKP